MVHNSTNPQLLSESRFQSWFTPHKIALIIMWLLTTITMTVMIMKGIRDTSRFSEVRYTLHAGYVAALLWYLIRSGPASSQLPELRPLAFPRWRYAAWLPVLGIALMLALTAFSDDGADILMLLMIVATVWIIVAWRREIGLRSVIQGVVVAAIAFAAGLSMMKNGVISETALYLFTLFVVPMYVAGGLLLCHTGLGGIQLLAKQYFPALRSFLWGCLLFVPLGLANAAGGSPVGSNFTWVSEWWMPFSLPLWSGIVEETWFRLFLVGLVYLLLRPAFQKHPELAVLLAVLFSGITFGLGHGRTLEVFLTTGLLYGVPYAAIFARRDWEHAVGAHYMVNMIPWMMVFLET